MTLILGQRGLFRNRSKVKLSYAVGTAKGGFDFEARRVDIGGRERNYDPELQYVK